MVLTTSELVASIRTVSFSITNVVPGDTLSALTRGLICSAGSRWAGGPWGFLDGSSGCGGCGGCGGRGGEDWKQWSYVYNRFSISKCKK